MSLQALIILKELGLEFNSNTLSILNSMQLYTINSSILGEVERLVISEWYNNIPKLEVIELVIKQIEKLFVDHGAKIPNSIFIYCYETKVIGKIDINTFNSNTFNTNILKVLIPWRR